MEKSHVLYRVLPLAILAFGLGVAGSGCSKHRPHGPQGPASGLPGNNPPAPPPPNSALLASIPEIDHITCLLDFPRQNVVGEGIVGISKPTDPTDPNQLGWNKIVTVWVVFAGDNRPKNGEVPHIGLDYLDGADNGRPASHYQPLKLELVKAEGTAQVYKTTVTTFPAGGSVLFYLLRHYDASNSQNNKFYEGQGTDSSYVEVTQQKKGLKFWVTSSNAVVSNACPGKPAAPNPLPAPNPPVIQPTPSMHFAHLTGGFASKELVNPGTSGAAVIGDGFVHGALLGSVDSNNNRVKLTVFLSNVIGGENNVPVPSDDPKVLPNYELPDGRPASHFEPLDLVQVPGTDLWEVTVDTFPVHGKFFFTLRLNPSKFVRGLDKDSTYNSANQSLSLWVANNEVFGPAAPGDVQPPSPPGQPPAPPPPPPAVSHFAYRIAAETAHITSQVVAGQNLGDGIAAIGTVISVNGNNAEVEIDLYYGPWGPPSDVNDNTPDTSNGEQPYAFPNYVLGAQTGRPAPDYDPISLTPVPGQNDKVWRLRLTKFPTTGALDLTLTVNGNSFNFSQNKLYEGQNYDSSYNPDTQSLRLYYNAATGQVTSIQP